MGEYNRGVGDATSIYSKRIGELIDEKQRAVDELSEMKSEKKLRKEAIDNLHDDLEKLEVDKKKVETELIKNPEEDPLPLGVG